MALVRQRLLGLWVQRLLQFLLLVLLLRSLRLRQRWLSSCRWRNRLHLSRKPFLLAVKRLHLLRLTLMRSLVQALEAISQARLRWLAHLLCKPG